MAPQRQSLQQDLEAATCQEFRQVRKQTQTNHTQKQLTHG
jgi:hypothetical protein